MGKAMPMPEEKDDQRLLEAFRDTRSEPAFTELVRRHLGLVFQVAQRRLGSAALAEEAAQNAFARLAVKVGTVAKHPERLRAWLHRTAFFEASTLARKESRLSRLPIEPAPAPMNRPEIYDRLDEALDKLPELDRELVLRHCCGGEDYRHMAEAVGKSEAACQKRVERSLARLAHGLGGAKTTTTAVVAVLAATTAKLPAAERIAAAALKQQATAGSVVGAISGAKVAACAALALAGGAAGWQQAPKPVAPPPPLVASTTPVPQASRPSTTPTSQTVSLAPRPAAIDRSLDDVLESIMARRLAPLIEFLPKATVADLRAIMAEDDIGDLSEGMGSFQTAHDLAARRWVELDPVAAFQYGLSRSTPLATRMLARWMETDPKGATDAFLALPGLDRRNLAEDMVQTNDDIASRLAAIDPEAAWVVADQRSLYPDPAMKAERAGRRIAAMIAGHEPPPAADITSIQNDFFFLGQEDREAALSQARKIPWPDLRATMLSSLGSPPPSATLPAGDLRKVATSLETAELLKSDPEGAVRLLQSASPGADRDAMYQVVSAHLAGNDSWRLLEIVAGMEGSLPTSDAVGRALQFAGKSDPRRVIAMLPDIASRFETYQGIRGFAKNLLEGWLTTDPAAAIRWAGEADLWLDPDELARGNPTTESMLELLSDPSESVRAMAANILQSKVKAGLADGSAKTLLERIPQNKADEIIQGISAISSGAGNYDEALRIASMASASVRQREILPQIGFHALRDDPESAVRWVKSLPEEDQRAVVDGIELRRSDPSCGGDHADSLRKFLQQIKP